MPFPLVPLLIGAASLYAGHRANKKNRQEQERQNDRDRQFNWDMYERQRRDATLDAESQNKYNAPIEQMNRLRQAGLNPNLVYGKGAENTAAMVRGSQGSNSSQPAPRVDNSYVSPALGQYFQTQNIQAQTDNLHANKTLLQKEAILKDASTAKIMQDTARGTFDLEQAQALRDDVIKAAQLGNLQTETNIELSIDKNAREELANSSSVKLTMQKILESKLDQLLKSQEVSNNPQQRELIQKQIQQIETATKNLKTEGFLKQIEAELRSQGLSPSDPMWARLLLKMLQDMP